MNNFGQLLSNYRKQKKSTLKKLSACCGISIGYLSDIEHSRKRPPNLDIVARIEDCLDIHDNSLLILARNIRRKRYKILVWGTNEIRRTKNTK